VSATLHCPVVLGLALVRARHRVRRPAVPVNRWLIARGKGHAAVHRTGVHGGPSPRLVGTIVALAFVFGNAVLIAEALDDDGGARVEPMGMVSAR
jgi:hypothetical protein